MNRPIVKIVNVETGEEIEREMNDSEFEQYQKDQNSELEKITYFETRTANRQAILDRLGLTEEEAKLLLS